jgi:hypothetical protein
MDNKGKRKKAVLAFSSVIILISMWLLGDVHLQQMYDQPSDFSSIMEQQLIVGEPGDTIEFNLVHEMEGGYQSAEIQITEIESRWSVNVSNKHIIIYPGQSITTTFKVTVPLKLISYINEYFTYKSEINFNLKVLFGNNDDTDYQSRSFVSGDKFCIALSSEGQYAKNVTLDTWKNIIMVNLPNITGININDNTLPVYLFTKISFHSIPVSFIIIAIAYRKEIRDRFKKK